jgi:hypothetical protein
MIHKRSSWFVCYSVLKSLYLSSLHAHVGDWAMTKRLWLCLVGMQAGTRRVSCILYHGQRNNWIFFGKFILYDVRAMVLSENKQMRIFLWMQVSFMQTKAWTVGQLYLGWVMWKQERMIYMKSKSICIIQNLIVVASLKHKCRSVWQHMIPGGYAVVFYLSRNTPLWTRSSGCVIFQSLHKIQFTGKTHCTCQK